MSEGTNMTSSTANVTDELRDFIKSTKKAGLTSGGRVLGRAIERLERLEAENRSQIVEGMAHPAINTGFHGATRAYFFQPYPNEDGEPLGLRTKAELDRLCVENRSLQSEIERLQVKTDAFDDLNSLIGEGYHSFEWDYDSDAEVLTLKCYDKTVQIEYPDNAENGTEKTLSLMLRIVEGR